MMKLTAPSSDWTTRAQIDSQFTILQRDCMDYATHHLFLPPYQG
jgi:hypothetical protein